MFEDTKQELDRLQEALLDEPEQETPETLPGIDELLQDEELQKLLQDEEEPGEAPYHNAANAYGKNLVDCDDCQVPVQEPVDEEPAAPVKGIRGLIIAAALLSVGIVLVVLWWLLRFRGIL